MNKKRFYFYLLTMSLSSSAFSQISKIYVEQPAKVENTHPYDSLENINFKNAKQHIGQTIYLKEDSWSKENGGYVLIHLYTIPLFESNNNALYKSVPSKDINGFNVCDYEQLKCKSFYVNKLLPNNKAEFSWDKNKWCLQLVETTSKDIVYLFFDELDNPFRYFLTTGYFEKLKKTYIGKEYIYKDFRWEGLNKEDNEGGLYSLNDGTERTDIPKDTRIKCIDMAIKSGGDNEIIAIMENSKYGKSYTRFCEIENPDYGNKIQTLEAYNKDIARNKYIIKKYGAQNAKLIFEGKVKIGFTKQMCIKSWGEPEEINKTSGSYGVHEQWVYGTGSYLYFENGILTTIQN